MSSPKRFRKKLSLEKLALRTMASADLAKIAAAGPIDPKCALSGSCQNISVRPPDDPPDGHC